MSNVIHQNGARKRLEQSHQIPSYVPAADDAHGFSGQMITHMLSPDACPDFSIGKGDMTKKRDSGRDDQF